MNDDPFDSDEELELHEFTDISMVINPINCFDYFDQSSLSPIVKAVLKEDLNEIDQWIKRGHSVNINDNQGNTPLHIAVITKKSKAFRHLLTIDDIRLNVKNHLGETPLFAACSLHEPDHFVHDLLAAGANPRSITNAGKTLLHSVATDKILKFLIKHTKLDVNAADYSGQTPLYDACENDDFSKMLTFIENGAEPDRPAFDSSTALSVAFRLDRKHFYEFLLPYAHNFNALVNDNCTIFHYVMTHTPNYFPESLDCLVDFDGIINGHNVISFAIDRGLYQFLRPLFDKCDYSYLKTVIEDLSAAWLDDRCDTDVYVDLIKYLIENHTDLIDPINNLTANNVLIKMLKINVNLDVITEMVFIFLTNGMNTLKSSVLDGIYIIYSHSNLFDQLLQMDIDYESTSIGRMPSMIYDLNWNVHGICVERKDNYRWFTHKNQCKSLKELARNASRQMIIQLLPKKSSRWYQTVVQRLNIPLDCRDIILFKRSFY